MSRDRGFPLAKVCVAAYSPPTSQPEDLTDEFHISFRRVHPQLKVPIWAVGLQTVVPIILGIIYLGSEIIFYSFFQVRPIARLSHRRTSLTRARTQLTTIGYLASYFIPIALGLFRGRDLLPPAYWRLPDAVAKVCLQSLVSAFPLADDGSSRAAQPTART